MHPEARSFLQFVRDHFPEYYQGTKVLDVGAGDINGNNRGYFTNCEYHGNDVVAAPNVTIVAKTSDLQFADEAFDIIISSECFEHDMHYVASLQNIARMLKPNGLFTFTCGSTGRGEHGTRRTCNSSFTTRLDNDPDWQDYYGNLTAEDVFAAIPVDELFESYSFFYNSKTCDLYFYGVKKGATDSVPKQPVYVAPYVSCTKKKE